MVTNTARQSYITVNLCHKNAAETLLDADYSYALTPVWLRTYTTNRLVFEVSPQNIYIFFSSYWVQETLGRERA